MLSPFQKRKLTRYFNCIDHNAKGYFTIEDVDAIAIRLAQGKQIPLDSDVFELIREGIRAIWSNARLYGFSQDPDKVTLSDWLVHEANILSKEEMVEGYMKKISRDVFDLVDTQGKGVIDEKQYCLLMESFAVEPGITNWCFRQMDTMNKGFLVREEFVRIVEDFHLSEDRSAPGNYLFGIY